VVRLDRVRAPVVLTLFTAGAVVAGTVHPATASADSGSGGRLTLSATGPATLPYRAHGTLDVTVGPAGSAATGTLRVTSTPVASGPTEVVLETAAQPSADAVQVPVVADESRVFVVSYESADEETWASPDRPVRGRRCARASWCGAASAPRRHCC
jgi:hypothetical protein